jgi:hypothetical protein
MLISFSPIRWDQELSLSVDGDVLTINGEPFDFSLLEDDDLLPAEAIGSDFIVDPVTRTDGDIVLTVLLPIPSEATESQRFPWQVEVTEGEVTLP